MKLKIFGIVIVAIVTPLVVAILISIPGIKWIEVSNDWIGFWGSYLGSILGGIITLLVLAETLKDSREMKERDRRQAICIRVSTLVSNFCVEMMAYRSKWNTLRDQAHGKEIDAIAKIEYGATTEEPRRIYFESDILLKNIPEADSLLEKIESALDAKITQKTVKETEAIMNSIRDQAREFIDKYSLYPSTGKPHDACQK